MVEQLEKAHGARWKKVTRTSWRKDTGTVGESSWGQLEKVHRNQRTSWRKDGGTIGESLQEQLEKAWWNSWRKLTGPVGESYRNQLEPAVMVSFSPCFAGSVHPHRKAACISSWLSPHPGKQHFSHLSTVQHQSSRQESIHHRNHRRATYSWKRNRSTPRVLRSPILQQLQGKVIPGNESQQPKGALPTLPLFLYYVSFNTGKNA